MRSNDMPHDEKQAALTNLMAALDKVIVIGMGTLSVQSRDNVEGLLSGGLFRLKIEIDPLSRMVECFLVGPSPYVQKLFSNRVCH